MGFFDNVGKGISSYLNPVGYATGKSWLHNATKGPAPAPPGQTSSAQTYRTGAKSANITAQELANRLFGGNALDYSNTFVEGYNNLGQPGTGNDLGEVTTEGVRALATAFADRVYQKTGTLPSEDAVKSFVGQTVTPGFTSKFIQGIAPDQLTAQYVDTYLQGNPDALVTPGTKSAEEQRLSGLNDQLNKIYDLGKESLVSGYDDTVYNPAKTRAVDDLAGQGMLTNPNSRYTLNQIEANRGRDIRSGLNTLESERATGSIDIGKTIEDIIQKNRDRSQNAYQFNREFNANRDDTAFNQANQRRGFDLAAQIGRMQADAKKPGTLDYINTAIGGLGAIGSIYGAYKGVK